MGQIIEGFSGYFIVSLAVILCYPIFVLRDICFIL